MPFTVGNKVELWNKIMKEVKLGRVAGPFSEIPYQNYIQSPVGLVPKAGGKTRLIFHLSFEFSLESDGKSLNASTPRELCSVHYNDIDTAVRKCLELSKLARQTTGRYMVFLGKTVLSSAFRVLPLKISCFCWLVFKAEDPADGKFKYFVEKCLPFGASISCSHYQRFSNALRHILEVRTQRKSITNYLDDFLFTAIMKWLCNQQIHEFLILCEELAVPVAVEKTEWASTMIVFLGILLNGEQLLLCIPLEKKQKALKLLNDLTGKKKATVKQLQVLTGYLNFLTKAITPGRTFTRRIYTKYANISKNFKPYHHVKLDQEFRFDCEVWRTFLTNFSDAVVCHLMIDLSNTQNSVCLNFYSDAAKNGKLRFGSQVFDTL